MNLSAIVITKNEELVISRCLESLGFCDETIVVDSGSTDRTLEIAQQLGCTICHFDWAGPAPQRNRGLNLARGKWCLLLDADEWITPELRDEIVSLLGEASLTEGHKAAFRINRSSRYVGQVMRHGGWWPDPVVRLVQKDAVRFEGGMVHERPIVHGPIGTLKRPLMHEPFRNIEQVILKMNSYSTWGAQMMHARGEGRGLSSAVLHGLWTFVRTYLIRGGFLDGRKGFLLAVSNAEGSYYKHVKAMLLKEQGPTKEAS